jgi:hypothetical protein
LTVTPLAGPEPQPSNVAALSVRFAMSATPSLLALNQHFRQCDGDARIDLIAGQHALDAQLPRQCGDDITMWLQQITALRFAESDERSGLWRLLSRTSLKNVSARFGHWASKAAF